MLRESNTKSCWRKKLRNPLLKEREKDQKMRRKLRNHLQGNLIVVYFCQWPAIIHLQFPYGKVLGSTSKGESASEREGNQTQSHAEEKSWETLAQERKKELENENKKESKNEKKKGKSENEKKKGFGDRIWKVFQCYRCSYQGNPSIDKLMRHYYKDVSAKHMRVLDEHYGFG